MSCKFKLLKDYNGFAKGSIITVAGQHRFADMNKGIGVPYVDPKPKAKPEIKVTSATMEVEKPKAKAKEVDAPAKDKQVKKSERNKQGKFQSKTK